MTYEQAQELEEAGFPQGRSGTWVFPTHQLVARAADRVYAPTLDELIAACGEDFEALIKQGDAWQAVSKRKTDLSGKGPLTGASPSEAVARLWLALRRTEK
jgi:hypothetical protein